MEFLQNTIAGNSVETWLIALVISCVALLLLLFIRYALVKQLTRIAAMHTKVSLWPVLVAVVRRTKWLFLLVLAFYIASIMMQLTDKTGHIINSVVIVAALIQMALWALIGLNVAIEEYRKQQLEKDPASVTTLNILNFIGKILIWSIVFLLVLDNLGVNITALVAGLGVGGVAVALALQAILGDLFASLSIVLDKPFVVGDFLIIGDLMGAVEYVGLKTTRLRSLSGEQLVFSNSDLLNSRIRNYGRMFERRVAFNIGVTYQTPRGTLVKIPVIIREAIEQQDKTRFDRSHFKEYGNSALVFESVYYVLGSDYNQYMDIQQAINLKIHERFEEENIEFAYPTQTLFIQQS